MVDKKETIVKVTPKHKSKPISKPKATKIKNNFDCKVENKKYVNMFDNAKYKAVLFNDNGDQVATVSLNNTKKVFSYNGGTYNIKWDCKTYFKRANLFNKFKYFFYNLNNPDPIEFDKENNNFETKFNAEQYEVMLKTDIVRKLNNVGKGIGALLTPRNLIIGLGLLFVLLFFMSGGSISEILSTQG